MSGLMHRLGELMSSTFRHRPRRDRRLRGVTSSTLADMIRAGPEPTTLAAAATRAWRRWRVGDPAGLAPFEAELRDAVRTEWRRRCREIRLPVVGRSPLGMAPAHVTRLVTPRATLDVDFADQPGARTPAEQFGRQVEAALADLITMAEAAGVATVGEVDVHVERAAYRVEHFLHVIAYVA
jgi:hypothetical protein